MRESTSEAHVAERIDVVHELEREREPCAVADLRERDGGRWEIVRMESVLAGSHLVLSVMLFSFVLA